MDNLEKLRIMLQHWIEHNKGHMEEFEKWRETMQHAGQNSVAGHLAKAIQMMAGINEELHQAQHEAGGHRHDDDDDHHHHHHHHHHH